MKPSPARLKTFALCAALAAAWPALAAAQSRYSGGGGSIGRGSFAPEGIPLEAFHQQLGLLLSLMDWSPAASLGSLKSLEALSALEPGDADQAARAAAATALRRALSNPQASADERAAMVKDLGPETASRIFETTKSVQEGARIQAEQKGKTQAAQAVPSKGLQELTGRVIAGPWGARKPASGELRPEERPYAEGEAYQVLGLPKGQAPLKAAPEAPEQGKVLAGPWKAADSAAAAARAEAGSEIPGRVTRVPWGDRRALGRFRTDLDRSRRERERARLDWARAQAEARRESEREAAREQKAKWNLGEDFSVAAPAPQQRGQILAGPWKDRGQAEANRLRGPLPAAELPANVIAGPWRPRPAAQKAGWLARAAGKINGAMGSLVRKGNRPLMLPAMILFIAGFLLLSAADGVRRFLRRLIR